MRKYIFLLMLFLLLPMVSLADNVLSFSQDAYLSMTSPVTTITVVGASAVQSITVGNSTIDITIDSGGSITLTSSDRKLMTTSPNVATVDCSSSSYSRIILTSSTVVTVSSDTCQTSPGGNAGTPPVNPGGGGSGIVTPVETPATTMPVTTTGQVTATSAAGGKTTLTTAENTTASVELPSNSVSANTEININPLDKTNVLISNPIPSGKNVIGNYIYDFNATSNGASVTQFLKAITLNFTYTDSHIAGFDESDIKVYYLDSATNQWALMPSLVDAANNKIIISTTHFTYFAVLVEKTKTCEIKDKSIVKLANQSALYWIYGNKSHIFPHSAVYSSWGLPSNFSTVKTVSASQLSSCQEGDPVPFRDGSLFRGKAKSLYGKEASAVFLVSEGKLRPIQSSVVYQALFKDSKWKKVIWVPDDLLSKFAYYLGDVVSSLAVHPDGNLVQYENSSAVYLIQNGKKRLFKSSNTLLNNGYKKSSIIIIPKTESYPDGEAISALSESLTLPK